MAITTEDTPVLDEAVWLAWVEKGRLREEAAGRKARVLGRIVFILLAFGSALYLLARR
jgi:hypothetical protein